MYDFAQPNLTPGTCCKCCGTGVHSWGTVTNGKPANSGTCLSCRGTGRQSRADIGRNQTYNRYKKGRNREGPMIDHTPAGAQHVLPGAEKAADATMAQRKADAPMRPEVPWPAYDVRQLDIIDTNHSRE